MYQVSADFLTAIKSNIRKFNWSGEIKLSTPISFTDSDIVSGEIIRNISGDSLEVGGVYASQLSIELILPNVSRYELYGKEIELSVKVDGASDVIPMGKYIITEALNQIGSVTITAFDDMIKLDDYSFIPANHTDIKTPFMWLSEICSTCGLTLGSSSSDIQGMPNGDRKTGFADVVTDCDTFRGVLGYLCAYLGGFSYIGRDGKLYVGLYRSNSVDTIPSSFRYTSNLSDFRTTYDGLYATYKDEGLQEYKSNTNTGGIILDLGVNPFLQFTNAGNRGDALQEIIDAWNGIYYVPYDSDLPLLPHYDPSDVITFIDNQAAAYDFGAITEITYTIGGGMHITCSGDNPRLATAQDRFTKSVAGLSADYNNGQQSGGKNFWLLHTQNDAQMTVGNSKTLVANIEWKQTVDVQRMGFMFTCEASLSNTATVTILITVDDDALYEFETTEEKAPNGKRILTSTCGFRVTGKTSHQAKVYMTVTDNPLIWSDIR